MMIILLFACLLKLQSDLLPFNMGLDICEIFCYSLVQSASGDSHQVDRLYVSLKYLGPDTSRIETCDPQGFSVPRSHLDSTGSLSGILELKHLFVDLSVRENSFLWLFVLFLVLLVSRTYPQWWQWHRDPKDLPPNPISYFSATKWKLVNESGIKLMVTQKGKIQRKETDISVF